MILLPWLALSAGVALLLMGGGCQGVVGAPDAHDLIHKTSYDKNGTLKNNADAMGAITKLHQQECKQFLQMLDLLAQIPEADGALLDHTLVLWCSQIGEHGHDLSSLPWILAGGKAGTKPGRYLKLARSGNDGTPHNNLFLSLAHAMGVQTDSFGNPKVCTGPLAGLLS